MVKQGCGLFLVDIQERLFPKIHKADPLLKALQLLIFAAKIYEFPFVISEQAPDQLGPTIQQLQEILPDNKRLFSKSTFSAFNQDILESLPVNQWIVAGIETHICVFQTVRDLSLAGYQVVVPQDAVGSRRLVDHQSALEEMRTGGIRLSTVETLIYEWIKDAKAPEFKQCLPLIKGYDA